MQNCSYTDKVNNICITTALASKFVREYLETIDQVPDFQVEGLENKYKLLAQFNNTILATRVRGGDHVEFVTWDKDLRGVSAGNYFGTAQDIICMADAGFPIENIKQRIDSLRKLFESLNISEHDRVSTENGIAITEYADMLTETAAKFEGKYIRIRKYGNAILRIVLDMTYGNLQPNEFYKRIAGEGEINT